MYYLLQSVWEKVVEPPAAIAIVRAKHIDAALRPSLGGILKMRYKDSSNILDFEMCHNAQRITQWAPQRMQQDSNGRRIMHARLVNVSVGTLCRNKHLDDCPSMLTGATLF